MICRYTYGVDIIGPDSNGKYKEKYRFCLGGLLIWILDHTDYYSSRCISK